MEIVAATYSKIGRIQSMLFVLVGPVDVAFVKPQNLEGARARRWWYIVELGSWQRLTCQFTVQFGDSSAPLGQIGFGQVEVLVGADTPGLLQKLVVELFMQPVLFADDAVCDAALIALSPNHTHLGVGRTCAVAVHLSLVVERRRFLVFNEKRVKPEMEHLLLITQSPLTVSYHQNSVK